MPVVSWLKDTTDIELKETVVPILTSTLLSLPLFSEVALESCPNENEVIKTLAINKINLFIMKKKCKCFITYFSELKKNKITN